MTTQPQDRSQPEEKIGVYVCHCGSNIAGTVDVAEVREWAGQRLAGRGVAVARDYKFMCSSLGQELIEKDIKEQGLTGSWSSRPARRICTKARFARMRPKRGSTRISANSFRSASRSLGCTPISTLPPTRPRPLSRAGSSVCGIMSRSKPLQSGDPPGHACGRRRDRGDPGGARNWPTPARRSTWSSASPRSAGTWPSSTRPSRLSTARLAS
jgi:hypothetical protein